MELNQLLITKEELPIFREVIFQIPIHPIFLDPKIKIDPTIAQKVFPQVAEEWHKELKKYAQQEKDKEKKQWYENVFLKSSLKNKGEYGNQYFGTWEDKIQLSDNGFAECFSISRNGGGSLYFNQTDSNCEAIIPGYLIRFSKEKAEEFKFRASKKHMSTFSYGHHNIDYYPGALFLRNWAIMYMNEVFKEVFK